MIGFRWNTKRHGFMTSSGVRMLSNGWLSVPYIMHWRLWGIAIGLTFFGFLRKVKCPNSDFMTNDEELLLLRDISGDLGAEVVRLRIENENMKRAIAHMFDVSGKFVNDDICKVPHTPVNDKEED